ncbi:MAG: ATP-dependent Clp protease proteolytic subunit [bacterium]
MYIKKRKDGLRESQLVGPHEYLADRRVIFLYGPIMGMFSRYSRTDIFGPSSIADTMLALSLESKEPIYLVIDSEGGSVDEGLMIYDIIKTISCPVYTVGKKCYSMAAILMSGGELGHRYIFPNTKTMLHLPMGGTSGDAEEIKIQAQEMKKVKDLLVSILQANGVDKTTRQILRDIDREHWMTSQETIDYGIADEVVSKGFFDRIVPRVQDV